MYNIWTRSRPCSPLLLTSSSSVSSSSSSSCAWLYLNWIRFNTSVSNSTRASSYLRRRRKESKGVRPQFLRDCCAHSPFQGRRYVKEPSV